MALDKNILERLGDEKAEKLIMTAEQAAQLVEDGMVVGISGFTSSGYPKAVPHALAERARAGEKIRIDLYTGASVGNEVDGELVETGVIDRRFPYQTNATMRKSINAGNVRYQDMHLSAMSQYVNYGFVKKPDLAIVEALAITPEGNIIPTMSVGAAPTYVKTADKVIIELTSAVPVQVAGMHDIFIPENPPYRKPVEIMKADDRIGTTYIECGWDKIEAIVLTDIGDKTRPMADISEDSRKIGQHIIEFFDKEVKEGRLTNSLLPIQSGVGSVANAVLYGLCDSDYENLTCYTEVMQDSMLELIRCGKATCGSTTAISPSPDGLKKFYEEIDFFKDKIVMRPQEISNNTEVVKRLGLISMNTALEVDIYGNVNSTHVQGSKIMNGIGGSGDFSRNAAYVIFTTVSIAKDGAISSIVPMCSHIDHTEHEVNVIVTEQGYADLRGLTPKERAVAIIENCAHPDYRDQLMDYFNRACEQAPCQTPHILEEALSWHVKYAKTGSMK